MRLRVTHQAGGSRLHTLAPPPPTTARLRPAVHARRCVRLLRPASQPACCTVRAAAATLLVALAPHAQRVARLRRAAAGTLRLQLHVSRREHGALRAARHRPRRQRQGACKLSCLPSPVQPVSRARSPPHSPRTVTSCTRTVKAWAGACTSSTWTPPQSASTFRSPPTCAT